MSVRPKVPKPQADQWVTTFQVRDPGFDEKAGLDFEVVRVTHPKGFPESADVTSFRRRFSDLLELHTAVSATHKNLHLRGKMPAMPKVLKTGGLGSKKPARPDEAQTEETQQEAPEEPAVSVVQHGCEHDGHVGGFVGESPMLGTKVGRG